jgi:hypothetical protein
MQFNFKLIKEDVRKIGVALIIAAFIAGFLKEVSIFEIIYPLVWGIVLVFAGAIAREDGHE